MTIEEVYKILPTHQCCVEYLESIRWSNGAICPYCGNKRPSSAPSELRYHCNSCHTSFSVTVGTPFHRTRIDLQKWFAAITQLNEAPDLTVRQLGERINVTKDTALLMLNRLRVRKHDFIDEIKQLDKIKEP